MNKMKKCEKCANLDKEKSNHNWIICPIIPLDVVMSGTSKNCDKFKEK